MGKKTEGIAVCVRNLWLRVLGVFFLRGRHVTHQTDKFSPIHRRIASAHVRVCQCTGFAGICRRHCRISDRREGVALGKFDEGMVDARAFTGTNRPGMYSAKGSMSDLPC